MISLDPGNCPHGWWKFDKYCYYSTRYSRYIWPEARQQCIDKGGDLASIHSRDEHNYVFSKLRQQSSSSRSSHFYWIGMYSLINSIWAGEGSWNPPPGGFPRQRHIYRRIGFKLSDNFNGFCFQNLTTSNFLKVWHGLPCWTFRCHGLITWLQVLNHDLLFSVPCCFLLDCLIKEATCNVMVDHLQSRVMPWPQ